MKVEAESILIFIATLGLVQGIIFCTYLLFLKSSKSDSSIFLSLLIIAISLRIGKSLLINYGYIPNSIFINVGLAGFFAIGPSFYLYIRSSLFSKKLDQSKVLLHYLPAIILILFSWLIPHKIDATWWRILYFIILIQCFVYLTYTFYVYKKHSKDKTRFAPKERVWFNVFIIGVFFVWAAYFINGLYLEPSKSITYLIGSILYSFLIYSLTYLVLKRSVTFERKYRYSTLKESDRLVLMEKINRSIHEDKIYRDYDITLTKMSVLLGVPANNLSQFINEEYGQKFTNFINSFRVKESKRLLKSGEKIFKISHIAYESGFSSISSFNASFKKNTGMTPSQYRDAES